MHSMYVKNELKNQPMDFPLLACTLMLVCFGIIMVFSASYYAAQIQKENALYYVTKQIYGAALGYGAMIFVSKINYNFLKRNAKVILLLCIIMLILVLIPGIGQYKNGARRWIGVGPITIQPAEIAKFGIILFLASSISERQKQVKKFTKGMLPYILILMAVCGLIYFQPNLSMIICIGIIWFAIMFAGGASKKQLFALCLLGIVAVFVMILIEPYRAQRLFSSRDPWSNASTSGYQVIQSLYAIASGGLFGTGLGNSRQKMLFLPYGESDFIFAIIAEEVGFIGILLYFGLCLYLFWRGIKIAVTCEDMFGSLVAVGVVSSISSQMAINVAVACNIIPTTGVTLPFISAGLTSLIVMMCNIGLLLNVSRQCSPRRRDN